VEVRSRATVSLEAAASYDDWIVSRAGSIAAADVVTGGQIAFTAVSVYAAWEKVGARGRGYADGSAHRILSDLSALMVRPDHRLVVAGDWNLLRGYGEYGDRYWKARYDTVFERWASSGLTDIHHQGFCPGRKDVHHGDHGAEAAPSPPVVHAGVQGGDRGAVPGR
jgi:hypothetical protein